jgi:hypothetical protein
MILINILKNFRIRKFGENNLFICRQNELNPNKRLILSTIILSKTDKKSADITPKNLNFDLFMVEIKEDEDTLFNKKKDIIF